MRARNTASLVVALSALLLAPAGVGAQDDDLPHPLCKASRSSDKCQDGGGRQAPGGGEKVSHKG